MSDIHSAARLSAERCKSKSNTSSFPLEDQMLIRADSKPIPSGRAGAELCSSSQPCAQLLEYFPLSPANLLCLQH